MEENQSAKNIRIAKNTFFLYLRMFLMMGISLYTSRIVLSTLGEVDYGLYNVVGGIVTMFTFVNFAMTCATNRYLSFELGKNNIENVNKVFSTSIIIHVVIAIFIFLLGETIGLWFLNTQMTIPADRMVAANWIYQLSILSCMVMIVSVPYNAIIISNLNILDDVKRILAQPFECRKTSLPDGALHNVQKELENMINAIDKDIYSFTPSYGKYLIDCWLGDELVDKLLDVSCQYEKLIKLK